MKSFIALIMGVFLLMAGGLGAVVWSTCRVYVPEDQCAVLIRQSGDELPSGQLVADKPGQQGIQREVLGPGRHWRNPVAWRSELKPLTVVPSGNPRTWRWIEQRIPAGGGAPAHTTVRMEGEFPMVGVLTRKIGPAPADGSVIVDRASGARGILREVLTPGTYKLNPYVYEIELHPAVVIPPGFVGVVTNLFGETPEAWGDTPEGWGDVVPEAGAGEPEGDDASSAEEPYFARPLALPGQRGTLADVLQPGVYFINPKLQRVTPVEIGYHEYSQVRISEEENYRIEFPSDTGYIIRVGVTVIWGIHPRHAAQIVNEYGGVERVLERVIGPQLRSICRNIGSTYAARDFIQGEKREQFQRALTTELRRVCKRRNIDVQLALVRDIEVNAPGAPGDEVSDDLKRTIQQSYIAIESQLTKEEQREAATAKAQLEEELKKIDIARETIQAETRVMVAQIDADASKEAATIDAEARLEIATIREEVATLEAQRTEILGRAAADVQKLKKGAEADGYRMLVAAFGSPQAYNLFTFAEGFQPDSIQLFYAGDGTFWTDLKRFEEVGAVHQIRATQAAP